MNIGIIIIVIDIVDRLKRYMKLVINNNYSECVSHNGVIILIFILKTLNYDIMGVYETSYHDN